MRQPVAATDFTLVKVSPYREREGVCYSHVICDSYCFVVGLGCFFSPGSITAISPTSAGVGGSVVYHYMSSYLGDFLLLPSAIKVLLSICPDHDPFHIYFFCFGLADGLHLRIM